MVELLWMYAWAAWMSTLQPYATLSSRVSVSRYTCISLCIVRKIQTFPMLRRQPPDSWRITWRIVNFLYHNLCSLEYWMRWTPHSPPPALFASNVFDFYLLFSLSISLCVCAMLIVWSCLPFVSLSLHMKISTTKANRANPIIRTVHAARPKKGLCCVCIVLYNVFSICTCDENIRFCIFQVRFDVCLHVCDAMRYFLWFCAVAKPMTWPTVSSHAHAHTFPIQMINMLSIFDLNKMRRNQCELYTHYTYSRHPNCTCKFVVCTQEKCVSMCICFSLCALFV